MRSIRILLTLALGLAASTLPSPARSDSLLRVLAYNIYWGGQDHDPVFGRQDEWLEVIRARDPDVILLQECNGWAASEQGLLSRYVDSLNATSPGGPLYRGYLGRAASGFHVVLITRLPVLQFRWFNEVQVGAETIPIYHVFIHAVLQVAGERVHAIGVHFKPGQNRPDREREARGLLAILDSLPPAESVWIGGDFNSYSPVDCALGSPTPPDYAHGALPPDIKGWEPVGYLLDRGFVDSFRTLHPLDLGYTQETTGMHPGGLGPVQRVDFLLRSPGGLWQLETSEVANDAIGEIGSDHYAVLSTYRRPDPAGLPVVDPARGGCVLKAAPSPAARGQEIQLTFDPLCADAIEIFAVDGRLVRELGAADRGWNRGKLRWDGRDSNRRAVPTGAYLARLRGGACEARARFLVVR